jgi:hypothetical protein
VNWDHRLAVFAFAASALWPAVAAIVLALKFG